MVLRDFLPESVSEQIANDPMMDKQMEQRQSYLLFLRRVLACLYLSRERETERGSRTLLRLAEVLDFRRSGVLP